MNSRLSFFKFISSSEKIDFPPGAAAPARMGVILGNVAFLKDKGQHLWEVGVERDGDGFSFKKGWPRFYRENRLEHEDCVLFTYHGDNLFHFQLLDGRNGFEIFSVKEEEEFSDDEEEEDDDDDEVDSEEEHEESTNNDESDATEMEKGDYEEEETTSIGKTKQKPGLLSLGRKRGYKKQIVPDCYGHDIFESGLAIRPRNPYFVSRSRKPRRNELYIPRDVIVDNKLEIPTTLFLVDGTGKKWKASMKKWKDGRVWCTRGWKSLCNVNNIGLHDTCICEFVQQEQGGLCLHIRIVDVDGAPHAASK